MNNRQIRPMKPAIVDAVNKAISAETQINGLPEAQIFESGMLEHVAEFAISELIVPPLNLKRSEARRYVSIELGNRPR